MPRRDDIHKILLLGSSSIVIGQAAEFDYSGTQACIALREEGYEVVLVNSNPATIMTDPETADRTYIEPLTPELVEKVIAKERPDALLPTMGGQTALNIAVALAKNGALEKYGVELIGAKLPAIEKAEDRQLFKEAMDRIGVNVCPCGTASTVDEAKAIALSIGSYPLIIRPAFTMGGSGGGIAYNQEEFEEMAQVGIDASPVSQILIDKSLLGWKEYELEVMRDLADNVVIICSIENLDPMGIHTGDSITVAPAQTLTDKEYQRLRDAAIKIIREIGVETGGSNIQFAVNPVNGEFIVIEMNPRVSRSSALASKATGFPIAKFAAKLAVGYTLDEINNDTNLKSMGWHHPDALHLMVEAMRIAYADRSKHLGDPNFVKVPVEQLTSRTYAAKRRQEIRMNKARPSSSVQPVDKETLQRFLKANESPDTSHLTVVDEQRNAVSLTFTINLGFGSSVVTPGTGILLNNEMDDFAVAPGVPNAFSLVGAQANAIAPRKTPLSSMTPTIVTENGRLRMAVGSPGGSTIITTVLQVILNVLEYNMDAGAAVSAPRLHHQWLPDQLRVEAFGLDAATLENLRRRGHKISEQSPWGNANAIVVTPDGRLEGAADPRGEGSPSGY